MNSLRDDGGPAFPRFEREHIYRDAHDRSGELQYIPKDGMSLRDYFAAKAMQKLILDPHSAQLGIEAVTKGAYAWADAMLKAREQSK